LIVFGPVPSRRLGRSIGINNIPSKTCSYSCIYCQVGRTTSMTIERAVFYDPRHVADAVRAKVARTREMGKEVDYLTLVPDGEPTLDIGLGDLIDLIKPLGIRIAVISNASLIWREDVRRDLDKADWVSLKVDSTREETWRRVNRPHGSLRLASILDGIRAFASSRSGLLVTETMLLRGVNDSAENAQGVAAFLQSIQPDCAYLSIPCRPPAEADVHTPEPAAINRAYQVLDAQVPHVEYLIGYEGNAFARTGDVAEDLLSITAVHPMRREAVAAFLSEAGTDWAVVESLLDDGYLTRAEHEGTVFYVRRPHPQIE